MTSLPGTFLLGIGICHKAVHPPCTCVIAAAAMSLGMLDDPVSDDIRVTFFYFILLQMNVPAEVHSYASAFY